MVSLALTSLAISALPWWLTMPASTSVLLVATVAINRYRKPRYVAISHDQTGWQLRDRNGDWRVAALRHHAQLGSWVILDFSTPAGRWNSLLTSDAIDSDTRRRLLLVLAATRNDAVAKSA